MRRLRDEQGVHRLEDSPCRNAMIYQIRKAHDNADGIVFDALADCGGNFFLLESGDDPKAVALNDGMVINLTDLEKVCYEFIDISEDGAVFVLFLATNDAGGPCFFIPNEPWIGHDFQRALAGRCEQHWTALESHNGD